MSLLLIACLAVLSQSSVVTAAIAPNGQLFGQINRIPASSISQQLLVFRGGADSDDEYDSDEYDSEYDSDEEEEEPIVTKAKKLATSTKSATQKKALKQTAVKNAALKSKVSVAMASSSSKAVTKKKGVYKRFVPYIVRACLNPFTLVAMTKAYFVSLCDINYLNKEVSEQRMSRRVDLSCHDNNQIYVYSVSHCASFLLGKMLVKRGLRALNSGILNTLPDNLHSFCVAVDLFGYSPSLRLFSWIIPMHLIFLCMEFSERTKCASFIEIIRVITAKYLFARHVCL